MNIEEFGTGATGFLVPLNNDRGPSHAFVPTPLAEVGWEWPEALWPLLLEARIALAELDGTGKHLANPNLVLRPLQNREAQKSSSLEGTYTDPQQQVLFAADPKVPDSRDDPANAQREVFNYSRALRLRQESAPDTPLSLWFIRQLHGVLMDGVRGSDQNPGSFRERQNQIGRPARFVPPPVTHLSEVLGHLEPYIQNAELRSLNPLVEAFLVHYQFETIHPFMDGNGRVGRLLLSICIQEWCGLSNQWLYMSEYFDRNKDAYIDRLYGVSTRGDWEAWIAFCLHGVVEQARDTIALCDRLVELHRDFHQRANELGGSVRLSQIVDHLFEIPLVRITDLTDTLGVTYPTAKSDVEKLEAVGILTQLRVAKVATYYCEPIINLIYGN